MTFTGEYEGFGNNNVDGDPFFTDLIQWFVYRGFSTILFRQESSLFKHDDDVCIITPTTISPDSRELPENMKVWGIMLTVSVSSPIFSNGSSTGAFPLHYSSKEVPSSKHYLSEGAVGGLSINDVEE
ncbi:hypothetical protein HAX54_050443 [Datura stramonium]|uniref:Uncharacterized protein n=1 Tax=Datura stramonium TaxID=4076 RepID=A0ABS8WLE3_DATST|nr:hypothetical protein [Datura stramonium]